MRSATQAAHPIGKENGPGRFKAIRAFCIAKRKRLMKEIFWVNRDL
jgi:hypothetical protein